MGMRSLAFILVTAVHISHCAIHQSFDEVAAAPPYDFIVAGGGTAGSVVANRLTENPKFRVLVLEAGPSNEGVLDIESPGLVFNLENSPFDWNFTTIPQAGLNNRPLAYPRGHVLGGSSSINGMFYTRGSSDDYDRWAAVTGDEGWSWKQLFPFILRNEHFTTPADGHSTVGQFDPKFHNFTGINFVSLPGFAEPLDDKIIQTSKDLKNEFPFNLDMNSGTPLGLGWLQSTIGNGSRSSAATSYLGSRFINRPNLDVVLNTLISRVLTSSSGSKIDLRTIQFTSGTDKTLRTVTAKKELILSLGSIGTPHILLNSGIGDRDELEKVGVESVLHLPSVGKNLTDQPDISLSWLANLTATPENATSALNLWLQTHTGPFSNGLANQVAWTRVPPSIFKDVADPSAGPHTPHFEFVLQGTPQILSTGGSTLGMGLAVVTPASRGSVSLKSNDPFDTPLIDPAFLTADIDIVIMKEAIASAKRFFAGPAWKDIIIKPQGAFGNATTDDALEQFIRNNADITAHPVGTAAMSPRGAQFGVVDPDLLIKGAEGLRIVDASIMPFVTCGHTQAPTYAIAERASELIKQTWA